MPDVVMYNALMSAYAANGNWQGAEDVLGRMTTESVAQPNVVTYSSLINAYANKGRYRG
jgi:pentatricopeptide repeat protein